MTSRSTEQSRGSLPFILRFAKRIDESPNRPLRYDESRQIAQVKIDGRWIDTPDAGDAVDASTRMTKVVTETTDDQ